MQTDPYFSTSKKVEFTYQHHYSSCIKIAGLPILPPLITNERRALLLKYKDEAISIEVKLQKHRSEQQLPSDKHDSSNPEANSFSDTSGVDEQHNQTSDSSGIFTKSVDSSNIDHSLQTKPLPKPLAQSKLPVFVGEISPCKDSNVKCEYSSSDSSPDIKLMKNIKPVNNRVVKKPLSNCINEVGSSSDKSIDAHSMNLTNLKIKNLGCYKYQQVIGVKESSPDNITSVLGEKNNLEISPTEGNNEDTVISKPSEVIKDIKKNLFLSPCRNLVLKCDIFSAVNIGSVCRSDNKENLSARKALKFEDFHSNSNIEVSNARSNFDVSSVDQSSICEEIKNVDPEVIDEIKESPPRLVRQNSYTLEAPSPELLAYLKKHETESVNNESSTLKRTHTWTVLPNENQQKKSENFKPFYKCNSRKKSRKSWNIEEARSQWNKQKKNMSVTGISEKDSISNNGKHKQKLRRSESFPTEKHSPQASVDSTGCMRALVNMRSIAKVVDTNETKNKQSIVSETNVPLMFSTTSDDCSNTVDSLEVRLGLDIKGCSTFRSVKDTNTPAITLTPEKDLSVTTDVIHNNMDKFSISTSSCNSGLLKPESTINSGESSVFDFKTLKRLEMLQDDSNEELIKTQYMYSDLRLLHHRQIEELLNKQEQELQTLSTCIWQPPSPVHQSTSSCHYNKSPHEDSKPSAPKHSDLMILDSPTRIPNLSSSVTTPRTATLCSRRLDFGEDSQNNNSKDFHPVNTDKEQKAATLITAYARGFLVRRLFKTERVVHIIKSIMDSMHCALNLDTENSWMPSDIELRERLMVQIEAGIRSLHNVFSLPNKEKMAIIRIDREKKQKRVPCLPLNIKPALSTATQRVMLRKQQRLSQDPVMLRSKSCIKQKLQKPQRRVYTVSDTSYSNFSPLSSQSHVLQKSSGMSVANRRPWK